MSIDFCMKRNLGFSNNSCMSRTLILRSCIPLWQFWGINWIKRYTEEANNHWKLWMYILKDKQMRIKVFCVTFLFKWLNHFSYLKPLACVRENISKRQVDIKINVPPFSYTHIGTIFIYTQRDAYLLDGYTFLNLIFIHLDIANRIP